MDGRKMRAYPQIIVSLLMPLVLSTAALHMDGSRADFGAGVSGNPVRGMLTEVLAVSPPAQDGREPKAGPMQPSLSRGRDFSAEDSKILLKIAMAEAEGESVEGKALVMLVVLNRVQSEDFPSTVEGVVFQPGQFSPVREDGRYYTTEPDKGCYEALELVRQGWDESRGALYFESCTGSSWHSENLEYLYRYGNHKFYR